MHLEDIIYKRQSIRKYNNQKISDECINSIEEFIDNVKPLYPNINSDYDIVDSANVKTIMNWKAPYYLQIYSQNTENCFKNIGFIYQQVDLYLQGNDIGSCWVGVAKPRKHNHENLKYIITIAFGKSDEDISRSTDEFKRKSLDEISDNYDDKLNVARLAPSAMNSQPWYFTHNNDNTYNIYRKKQNIIKRKLLDKLNQIDIGIALAHLYVANRDSFEYFTNEDYKKLDGYIYEGSFKI
ncbi:MAG: nitroreductase family protein [Methanosphaera sp.]|nr:nitroreductase family protein [Methanosphaera sp.]